MKNLLEVIFAFVCFAPMKSCSDDVTIPPATDEISLTKNSETDFFLNKDGTVNIEVAGGFMDDSSKATAQSRGLVHETSTSKEVDATNTVIVSGTSPITAEILIQMYIVRGYFELEDGSNL